ncbi:MAG: 4-hydroxy-3-methylbut-2-enyl diphosphate reductase [Rhodospirillaceae bacterium]|jgi:4-hydroxy-3-methylbut-2-enyl diphosphate reductase|nr:4-hydroxy-3-methylbut-2-enyl diphosphate reductase [Rhodospirillaceae bacterium]|tara:strand:+ start:2869 stop:3843 length:975 start_codon:yes stop_codon:yes gene_type:complete
MAPKKNQRIDVWLASPRGFCAGVERAIEIVERALDLYGPPVYVRHEIVHNKRVVETLRAKGAVFVEEVDDVPDGAVTIFSAHGVSETVENQAKARDLPVIDATCPLVSKVHKEGQNHAKKDRQVILIGHEGHPEVEGTQGRIPGGVLLVTRPEDVAKLEVRDPDKLAYVTQTTLSVDETRDVIEALKERFPAIIGPDVKDICYATQNRQQAVRNLAEHVDLLLVVGATNSSNSNRLREIGTELGVPSYLIDDAGNLDPAWLKDVDIVGVTAGASAPEELVQEVIARLGDFAEVKLKKLEGVEENITFKLPRELKEAVRQNGQRP